MTPGRGLALLFRSANPARKRELLLLSALILLASLADALTVVTLSRFLDEIVGAGAGRSIWPFALAILLASGLRFAVTVLSQHFSQYAARDLIVDIQARVLALPYEKHFSRHSADLLAIAPKVDQLMFGMVAPLLMAAGALVTTLFVLASLYVIDGGAALAALALVTALFVAISLLVRRRIAEAGRIAVQCYSERIRVTQESLGGLRDLIINGSRPAHVARLHDSASRLAKAGLATSTLSVLPRYLGEALGIAAVAGLALLLSAHSDGIAAAVPTLGAFALAGQRLMPMAQALYQGWSSAVSEGPLLRDVAEYLALPKPPPEAEGVNPPTFERFIELRDVSYRYPGAETDAVDRLSLQIAKGELVALVGATGAGKSSVADLLMGLLRPQAGKLAVDGMEIDDGRIAGWQRLIAHVPQAPFLIDASLADNIAMSPDQEVDPDRLQAAVEAAGLLPVAVSMPSGLATQVGENGVRLSGGQRQRVALARAIYRRAPLLILDEATNAVDDETERGIREALLALKRSGTTIVLIAHRSTLLDAADRVVRLAAGQIVNESVAIEPGVEHEDRP